MKRIIAAFAAVAAAAWPAAVFTGAGVAHADDYMYFPLLANFPVNPCNGECPVPALLTLPVFFMKQGETRRVTDQLAISMPGGYDDPEMGNSVACYPGGMPPTAENVIAGASGGSGTNYMGDGGAFQWNASALLVAPSDGDYYCGISVYVNPGSHLGFTATVLPPTPENPVQATDGTWLEVSSSPPDTGGQQWSWSPPPPPQGVPPCPTNDKFNDTGAVATTPPDPPSQCVYLGGPNPNYWSIDYWPNPDGSFQPTWSASNDATVVDFAVTGQNTVCFQYTGSCREIDDGPGDTSTIRSGLVIQQEYPPPAGFAEGAPCGNATVVYSEDTLNGTAGTQETLTFSRYQHHAPVYYDATVLVSQLCGGSRTFSMSLYTQLDSGIPIKFENKGLNVINLERAPTKTVPNVIGLTQDKATAAIEAVGLTVFPPPVCSPGPPPYGVVSSQNSPGNTVEPAGSPVQLTLSCGLLHQ